jgi:hypothetical protein
MLGNLSKSPQNESPTSPLLFTQPRLNEQTRYRQYQRTAAEMLQKKQLQHAAVFLRDLPYFRNTIQRPHKQHGM